MKKWLITLSLIGGLSILNLSSNKILAEEDLIEKRIASTYVARGGQTLDKIIFQYKELPSDFLIDNLDLNVEFVTKTMNSETFEEEISTVDQKIESIELQDNNLIIDIEDIIYSTVTDITVTSSDESLNAKMDDFDLTTQTVDLFKHDNFTDKNGTELSYWLYIPEDSKNLPLVIWEHGGGEVLTTSFEGSNLVANQGATTWIENGEPVVVLSVQYPENYGFGITEIPEEFELMQTYNKAKYELVQTLIEQGIVDETRVYITGASSGGGGGLRFIMDYPDLFAGGLIICAKDTIVPISEKYELAYQFEDVSKLKLSDEQYEETYKKMEEELAKYPKVKDVPIWFVHAENDQVCTSYTSSIMYDILEKNGATGNKLSLYTDQEMEENGIHVVYHGSWEIAYENQEMIDWLFQQQNNN